MAGGQPDAGFQLDDILYGARFLVVSGGIVDAGNSDHKPVWADLERVDPI